MNDQVVPARGLAGVKRDCLDDPVPLVEHSQHRNSLRHRCDSSRILRRRSRLLCRLLLRLLAFVAASGQRQCRNAEQ
jgi:hypothetical protein